MCNMQGFEGKWKYDAYSYWSPKRICYLLGKEIAKIEKSSSSWNAENTTILIIL